MCILKLMKRAYLIRTRNEKSIAGFDPVDQFRY